MNVKHLAVTCVAAAVAALTLSAPAHAKADPCDKMARELSEAASSMRNPKIAIMPFSYVDKRASNGGAIVSERLTTRIVRLKKLTVIERQLLENVLEELHLEASGLVDAETTKRLGKVLGVEAIVAGTLMDLGNNTVEVNARVIKTDTAEVITTSSVEMERIWTDGSSMQNAAMTQQQSQPAQSAQQTLAQTAQPAVQQARPAWKGDVFFDFLAGSGDGEMRLKFNNTSSAFRETDLNLDLNGNGLLENSVSYKTIDFPKLKTAGGSAPFGIRMSGFGKHWGGAIEMSYYKQYVVKQKTTATYGGGTTNFEFFRDEYITVKVLNLASGDLMFRFTDQMVQPYVGAGIGLTMNFISAPNIYGYTSGVWGKPMEDLSIGFLFRLPVGVRFVLGDSFTAFAEYRPVFNVTGFDRDVKGENDVISMKTNFLLFGIGAKFQ